MGALTKDVWLLLATRFIRLFAYGSLSVVLVFYLVGAGLTEQQAGLLVTLTLAGDVVVSLFLTTRADRIGRKRVLLAGAALMAAAGLVFATTQTFVLLLIAGTIGVISPSGNEVGPFLPIEQAALSSVVSSRIRTDVFAWYTLAGAVATALGALAAGLFGSSRTVIIFYAGLGGVLAALFSQLSRATEVTPSAGKPTLSGLHRSRGVIAKLSVLFALDSFAGGFVMQSFSAYWFYLRWGVSPEKLGAIFFGANVLAGLSALVAARLAARFGLIRTMVATHLPSNVLLILVPLMPTLPLAITVLLLRFSISQMDVPTRQAYTMAVVEADERSAAAGITGVARTTGAAISPFLVGLMFARPPLINLPFILGGTLKIVYDVLVWIVFSRVKLPEDS